MNHRESFGFARNWLNIALKVGQWPATHMFLVFLLWSLWLAFESIAFGPSSFVRLWDNADSQLPARIGQARMFMAGQFSYWNPQWASGVDVLASGLNPLADMLVYVAVPGWLAHGLFMWLQRFLAGYFTYRLLDNSLRIGTLPAFLGGLFYSLFAQTIVEWESLAGFTVDDTLITPGFPFVLWALGRIDLSKPYRPYFYFAGLGVLVSISSYYYQTLFFLPIIIYWFWLVIPKRTPQFWGGLALFASFWLISEVPVLWPTVLNAPLSHRADPIVDEGYMRLSGTWLGHGRYMVQMAKDNAALLALFLGGFIVAKGRDRNLLMLVAPLIFLVVLFLMLPWINSGLQKHTAILSGFDIGRVRLGMPFLIVVAGSVGLHLIAQEWRIGALRNFGLRYGSSLQASLIVVALVLVTWQSVTTKQQTIGRMSGGENYKAMFGHPDLISLADSQESLPPFRVATVNVSRQYAAFAWAYGLESADSHLQLYPKRYREYWEQVVGPLSSRDAKIYDYLRYYGNHVYLFRPTNGFSTNSEVPFTDYYNLDLLSLSNVRYIVSGVTLRDNDLSLVSTTDGDDKRLAWGQKSKWSRLLGTLRGEQPPRKLYIYENLGVLPRFFLAGHANFYEDNGQVLAALGQASIDDLRNTAYINKRDQSEFPLQASESQVGTVGITSYKADRIVLEVDSLEPSVLVISNSYSPYWKAWVDGAQSSLFPVNHAFQGLHLGDGRHVVVLEYHPPYAVRFSLK